MPFLGPRLPRCKKSGKALHPGEEFDNVLPWISRFDESLHKVVYPVDERILVAFDRQCIIDHSENL